jgi:hypothetical protein
MVAARRRLMLGVVGQKQAVAIAVKNIRDRHRWSTLRE